MPDTQMPQTQMPETQTPTGEHAQFDEICATVGDHETLPTVVARPAEDPELSDEERAGPLDELILAALVSPY
jgi:hypothetical protein